MKIVIGSDHAGFNLKSDIIKVVEELGHDVTDVGCDSAESVDYADFGIKASEMVANGEMDRGIVICGTGIGMSMSANKVKGIRCALVHDLFTAKATREHNDSNVLAMGERIIGPGLAQEIARTWLTTDFEGGRHERRIMKVMNYENGQPID
ncbi:ribose 5-phosphate isomerase B [Salisediminibacterium beveridgei]|uniref:Ribose 5-phosphate isomerase B n=1 Tax=Salisediminibacterium beveridgei TaxID=632773 RepID=A0A1D7QRD8_9BACI|nr:ribose 5-phosphate isomerase B [Salisediminibacterium beveridgei]AOM81569.1 Ribose 5-phosphate isomerase B [Salisediminibacterium beveridgei]